MCILCWSFCLINTPRYATGINAYALPTNAIATTLGYTQPAGAPWSYPATAACPQITVSTNTAVLAVLVLVL